MKDWHVGDFREHLTLYFSKPLPDKRGGFEKKWIRIAQYWGVLQEEGLSSGSYWRMDHIVYQSVLPCWIRGQIPERIMKEARDFQVEIKGEMLPLLSRPYFNTTTGITYFTATRTN
jgi:hypothetical protein